MDIVDYINEVDRSNREQEAAYHVTLSKRDSRIRCVFYARPLFHAAACFIYTASRRDYNENIHFCGLSQKRDGFYMQKAPVRSETRVGALFC